MVANMPNKQLSLIKDHYRHGDQKTLGFTLQFADRSVRLGGEGDRIKTMRFKEEVAKVQVFGQFPVKDSLHHNVVFFNHNHDALMQYTLNSSMCDS